MVRFAAPRATADVAALARAAGRGTDRRVGADVARQGQRKAAGARRMAEAHRGRPAAGRACAGLRQPGASRGAAACAGDQPPARRASRALEIVEKVLTGSHKACTAGA